MNRSMLSPGLILAAAALLTAQTAQAVASEPAPPDFKATLTYTFQSGMFGYTSSYTFDMHGAIEDSGTVTTYSAYDEQGELIGRVWVLWGQHGTMEFLDLGSEIVSDTSSGKSARGRPTARDSTTVSEGEFLIVDGDGDYAGIMGGGPYVNTYRQEYVNY